MVSGYHFLPVAPASWRKTTPAAAVTSVNCRATAGGAGGATTVTCGAGLGDSGGFWESLHALVSRTRHTTLPTKPRRTMPPRCRAILPPPLPLLGPADGVERTVMGDHVHGVSGHDGAPSDRPSRFEVPQHCASVGVQAEDHTVLGAD